MPTTSLLARLLPQPFKTYYTAFREEYPFIDRATVVLYADPSLLPAYPRRHSLDVPADQHHPPLKVSLISTVRNEAVSAREWLESLLLQSHQPDEVIITDGGSTDGTLQILRDFASTSPIPLKVIEAPGANIARGRNIAIQNASHPIIACADFGCLLDREWLRLMVLPFETDDKIEVSAGYYQAIQENAFQRLMAHYFVKDLDRIDPQSFLPSSRSLAMKKLFWARVGGYPEWLTDAGEDTLFAIQARLQPAWWAFVPQAMVSWQTPKDIANLYRTYYRYAKGDGEAGIKSQFYWRKMMKAAGVLLMGVILLLVISIVVLFVPQWTVPFLLAIIALAALGSLWNILRVSERLHAGVPTALYDIFLRWIISIAQLQGFAAGVAERLEAKKRQA